MSCSPASVGACTDRALQSASLPARSGVLAAARAVDRRRTSALLLIAALIATITCLMISANRASAQSRPPTPELSHQYAVAMLGLLNDERAAHGLAPLQWSDQLAQSAHRHDLHMAGANTMAHQLAGEAYFATRISNLGYHWAAAGENVGWNADATKGGVLYLERQMYAEKAPDDGHRVNLLNRTFTQVGIDVYYDAAHNKIWFTQDFGRPAR